MIYRQKSLDADGQTTNDEQPNSEDKRYSADGSWRLSFAIFFHLWQRFKGGLSPFCQSKLLSTVSVSALFFVTFCPFKFLWNPGALFISQDSDEISLNPQQSLLFQIETLNIVIVI